LIRVVSQVLFSHPALLCALAAHLAPQHHTIIAKRVRFSHIQVNAMRALAADLSPPRNSTRLRGI
jgi:hypothetical protein